GQPLVTGDDKYRGTLGIFGLAQQWMIGHPAGERRNGPRDLTGVGAGSLGRALRLGDARCGDELHRTGDLGHRLRRADPPAIAAKLCTHGSLPALGDLDGLLSDLRLLERFRLGLLAQQGTGGGLEALLDLLDGLLEGLGGFVLELAALPRSEEHTSELQSRVDLVCR